ncbi:MAG: histidine kinase [Chitinophagaceae bacterium]|nr:histidine kinase [Chitinophagaceae bacterium]
MRLFILSFFLLSILPVAGQGPDLYFNNFNTANGLSNNKVNCILQDKRGFIWIGTDDGLNRYDGHRFQTFRHDSDTTSISGNIITDLLEDKNEILWIATADGGLTRYDYRLPPASQFRPCKNSNDDSNAIPSNIINALLEDLDGNLWLATSGQGLLRFDKNAGTFSEPIRRRARTILDLEIDGKGIIWGGREGGGLIKIDPRSMKYSEDERYRDIYAKLPHMTVASLFRDRQNNIWMGSWDKVVYKVDAKTGVEEVYKKSDQPFSFPGDDPLAFAEDDKSRIWIGGQYNGLYIFNSATQRFHHYRHDPAREGSLADNRVNCIFIDRSGIVWIGTNRGLSIHDPALNQFSQTFLPTGNSTPPTIYDLHEERNGNLLIGTSDGLYRLNEEGSFAREELKYKNEKLFATKFYDDPETGFYIGTNLSLFRYAASTLEKLPNTERDVVMNRIIESRVVSMVKDSIDNHPVLLVAPYGHFISYYDYDLKQWVNRKDSVRQIIARFNIKDNLIRKFFKAKNGTIWIASAKAGLGEWRPNLNRPINYYSNIPGDGSTIGNNNIYDIKEDSRGNLWVSTYGGGLYYFNVTARKFEHVTASHNLAEGVQLDSKGNVWLIANGNLHKYDPYRKLYTSFLLPDVEKSGGVKGYIFKDSEGKLYLSGPGYFITFHPERVHDVSTQPAVFFTDFKIFNESNSHLLFNKKIELKYNENFFAVEFAAPSYQAGYPVQYAHRLEGFDRDWVEDGTRNSINYTNLDGGDYTFKIRATVKPGVWSNDIAQLRIRIIPPFWKTWWFYVMCALVVAMIIYAIYRYRINELLKRQAIRNKIAQDLHDNVGSTLSSISVYSQVAKIYKEQNKHEALRDTLEKISGTSSEMISEMNDIVWAINPRNDNMETILNRMESFARPLLASKEVQFHFTYDSTIKNLNLEMTKRKNFYLIFKEAVNNALKYADSRNMWVNISYHHHQLKLTVRDDGRGFDMAKVKATSTLSGNGLLNMKLRAKEMKGSWVIDSDVEKGTNITLLFPIP